MVHTSPALQHKHLISYSTPKETVLPFFLRHSGWSGGDGQADLVKAAVAQGGNCPSLTGPVSGADYILRLHPVPLHWLITCNETICNNACDESNRNSFSVRGRIKASHLHTVQRVERRWSG